MPKSPYYWTYAACEKEAKLHSTLTAFARNGGGAYMAARKHGWLIRIAEHVPAWTRKPNGYWTAARIRREASKYTCVAEFRAKANAAYRASLNLGMKDEVCSHMPTGSGGKSRERFVYQLACPNKDGVRTTIYIGLTVRLAERMQSHVSRGRKAIRNMFSTEGFTLTVMNSGKPLPEKLAAALERRLISKYRRDRRYLVVNSRRDGGQLGRGSAKVWSVTELIEVAQKYNSRSQFAKEARTAYNAATATGLLHSICLHMRDPSEPANRKWTDVAIREAAAAFQFKKDFAKAYKPAYAAACRRGLDYVDEVCAHMTPCRARKRKPRA